MKLSFTKTNFTKVSRTLALGMLLAATVTTSCKKDETPEEPDPTPTDLVVKEVEGTITGDVTWSADTIYLLKGFVRVGTDNGTTISATGKLTIEPGTLILGDRETKGTLIVQRGSQIFAVGTEEKPIIFTSERAPGLKQPGDWGGVVLCGKAFNNRALTTTVQLEGNYGAYHGGTNDSENDDNSGELKYVRIEYAGIAINPNEEVNSLTMGSVGSGTKISYVQCSFGLDDAFEWFGGTVNCTNLIAYRCLDDDWDVDQGFKGNVQFALSIKDPNLADQSGSNGFEVDGPVGALSPTSGKFANMTVIGPKQSRETTVATQYQHAIQIRRDAKISIYNSFFTGFPEGISLETANTQNAATADELQLKGNVLAAVENWGGNGFGGEGTLYVNNTVGYKITSPSGVTPVVRDSTIGAAHPNNPRGKAFKSAEPSTFDTESIWLANNSFLSKWQDAGISPSLFEVGTPSVLPLGGSVLLSGAVTVPTGLEQVAYKGAFGSTDWTLSWTEWNPAAKNYTK